MILRIRNSKLGKGVSLLMVAIFILTLNPSQSFALTGGPAQPEFNSFTPIGTSDMVDLASGDFSYNIPLMDIGGFPINLAYSSGVTMDQEASWVGLGWDLSIGQINRQMRGLPDDFDGDEMTYENNIKDNWTLGGTFQPSPELFGFGKKAPEGSPTDTLLPLNFGISGQYNSYTGYSMTPSMGASFSLANNVSIGFNASSSPDGLVLSPSLSLTHKSKWEDMKDQTVKNSVGATFNSRQGLTAMNLSTSTSKQDPARPGKSISTGSGGSSKSFVPNTYTPSVQHNITTLSLTFNAALDATIFGGKGEAEVTGFFTNQYLANKLDKRRAYGYQNTEKDPNHSGVLDFNRENDGVFTVNSTNLPITNYTYDLYSVSGQGVGGMFQPFRSQVGYVYDNYTSSSSAGLSLGAEIGGGNTFDFGMDFEVNGHVSESGLWTNKNQAKASFEETNNENPIYEEVYFKNVGDRSADQEMDIYGDGAYENLGGYQPIRLQLGRVPYARTLKNKYLIKTNEVDPDPGDEYEDEVFVEKVVDIDANAIKRSERVHRNQTILKVTAAEAEELTAMSFRPANVAISKPHHTAGFIITRNDGARYIYGKPLYNTTKKEVTFAVGDEVGGSEYAVAGSLGDRSTGLVNYTPDVDNSLENKKGDHYFNRITTPPYAHTFLLTSLVSTDYSDIDAIEGPSEGDYGSYTLFSYVDKGTYKWRVPFEGNQANYNEGLRTDPTDDKASYIYGTKETSYIQKIETKTHVAIFEISERRDGFGVAGENGGIGSDSKMYKLDRIKLYSRGEYYEADGISIIVDAIPIKTVHFEYNYSLCPNIVNNSGVPETPYGVDNINDSKGKLTLSRVYFTYRNSNMGRYSAYNFTYGDTDHDPSTDNPETNPAYNLKGYDIWGNYKNNNGTTSGATLDPLSAPEFNYVEQNTAEEKSQADDNTRAWSITDIGLPSGGKIQVDYETDDYQYVQDQKAMRMFKLVGAGTEADPNNETDDDFEFDPETPLGDQNKEGILYKGNTPAEYLYFELDEEDQGLALTDAEYKHLLRTKYIHEIEKNQKGLVQFRMYTNMTKDGGKKSGAWEDGSFDFVTGYFEIRANDCQVFTATKGGDTERKFGSIRMKLVNMEGGIFGPSSDIGEATFVNPISKATWHFTRKYLSKYVYGLPNMEEGTLAAAGLESIYQAFENLAETVVGPNAILKSKKIGRRFVPEKSWIRLCEPTENKKGGGCRVKQIAMTDEWAEMTGATPGGIMDQKYGQEYTYTLANGGSSGVATYEPVGSKENPLVQPVFMNVNRLLAPNDENFIEKPFGESFFPNPTITYSRVTVKNLERVEADRMVSKHATGEVITEFYTSRDFPTITDQTRLQIKEDHNPLLSYFFSINVMKHLTLSQGYVIHLNDMNGKMKSQRVYAEGQDKYISGVDYFYDLNGAETSGDDNYLDNKGRLNNKVYVMDDAGNVTTKALGVEYNTINDFRAMESESIIEGVDMQTNSFMIGPLPIVVPTGFPKFSRHVDKLNISSTTKVINSYGILRKVVAHDAGASVSTRNLIWDEETGEVLLTQTVNEYGDLYYSLNFPAHWAHEGMSQASANSGIIIDIDPTADADYNCTTFASDGIARQFFFPGDEILITSKIDGVISKQYAWVDNVPLSGYLLSVIDKNGEKIVLDVTGNHKARIIRSGHRNIQSTSMASIVLQRSPFELLSTDGGVFRFDSEAYIVESLTDDWKTNRIVNAGAVEFMDDWALQCECGIDADATTINPYVHNQKGVWRANKSYLYLTGRHHNDESPDPRHDGFYTDFSLFYTLDLENNWKVLPSAYDFWTFTSEVTQFSPYGFEIENEDALGRKSAALYGYNYSFPLAVGANTSYAELAFDGFEDYNFYGCPLNEHFGFRSVIPGDPTDMTDEGITNAKAHTGKFSLKVKNGTSVNQTFNFDCEPQTED